MNEHPKKFIKFKDGSYVRADAIISVRPLSDSLGDRVSIMYTVGNDQQYLLINCEDCIEEARNIANSITDKEEK